MSLTLQEENEMLRRELDRTRANARKWHRAAQTFDKIERENLWLRERIRKITESHEQEKKYTASSSLHRYEHLRKEVTAAKKFLADNLLDQEVGGKYFYVNVPKSYTHAGKTINYENREEVSHPKDDNSMRRSWRHLNVYSKDYLTSLQVIAQRLIKERDDALREKEEVLKTL